jgi:hypothetical protein
MRNKMIFLAGVGVGYLLGARAGRERYEQIMRGARRVRENPTVQEAAGVIQAQAGGLVTTAKDVVSDKIGHTTIGNKVNSFLGHHDQDPDVPYPGAAGSNGVPARLDP